MNQDQLITPKDVFQIVRDFFNSTDHMFAAALYCADYRKLRAGEAMGERMSKNSLQFPLETSALFAAHSAALSIAYIRAERNMLDDNVTPEGYLRAVSHISEWELGDREEFVAEIISHFTFRASLNMVRASLNMVQPAKEIREGSIFPSFRSRVERNKDAARVVDAAKVLLEFIQKELCAESLKIHRDSPVEAENYQG